MKTSRMMLTLGLAYKIMSSLQNSIQQVLTHCDVAPLLSTSQTTATNARVL